MFLTFNGNCSDALDFYSDVFAGEITERLMWKQSKLKWKEEPAYEGVALLPRWMKGVEYMEYTSFDLYADIEEYHKASGYFVFRAGA